MSGDILELRQASEAMLNINQEALHEEEEEEENEEKTDSDFHPRNVLPKVQVDSSFVRNTSSAFTIKNLSLLDSRHLSASQLHLLLHPTDEETDIDLKDSLNLVCLNVGGKRHWALLKNFVHFPGTRLGRIARAKSTEEIMQYCDKYFPGDVPEFFFDRNWVGFNSILDVYRSGTLHLMNGLCALVTKAELEYWGIDELLLEPCCALKYYPEIELCVKEVEGEELSRKKSQERKVAEDFGPTTIGKLRKFLWNLTEYPETSKAAQVVAFTSLGAIVVSTICFILSTFPELQDLDDDSHDDASNETGAHLPAIDISALFEEDIIDYVLLKTVLKAIDWVTIGYFCLEYVVRFMCSPNKTKFFFHAMNLIDFLAVLPYFISALVESLEDLQILGKAGKIMRLVRVMRILRIFKLVRHFAGLQSLLYTLKQAYKELGLLIILVAVAVLTFSSLVFFAEKDSPTYQWTFIDSFWWGLMTLTTVGYGTQSPSSITGKAIGGFCALIGVFILTLPVPIVVNSFASYYKNRLWRNEVAHKRRLRAEDQAKLVKEILTTGNSRRPSFCGSQGSQPSKDNISGPRSSQTSETGLRRKSGVGSFKLHLPLKLSKKRGSGDAGKNHNNTIVRRTTAANSPTDEDPQQIRLSVPRLAGSAPVNTSAADRQRRFSVNINRKRSHVGKPSKRSASANYLDVPTVPI